MEIVFKRAESEQRFRGFFLKLKDQFLKRHMEKELQATTTCLYEKSNQVMDQGWM